MSLIGGGSSGLWGVGVEGLLSQWCNDGSGLEE